MKERLISLDEIKYDGTIWEAVGVSEEEFHQCETSICREDNVGTLAQRLGLNSREEIESFGEALSSKNVVEATIAWWKKRGRKEITLEEYIGTLLFIQGLEDFEEQIRNPSVIVILPKPERKDYA